MVAHLSPGHSVPNLTVAVWSLCLWKNLGSAFSFCLPFVSTFFCPFTSKLDWLPEYAPFSADTISCIYHTHASTWNSGSFRGSPPCSRHVLQVSSSLNPFVKFPDSSTVSTHRAPITGFLHSLTLLSYYVTIIWYRLYPLFYIKKYIFFTSEKVFISLIFYRAALGLQ